MNWTKLVIMAVVSFVVMYALMYVMTDSYGNVYSSLNQFYMAAMMTGAMVLIEMVVMGSMYEKKVKVVASGLGVVSLVLFFLFIRGQVGVSDREFLKSMITHHGSALLMCENAKLKDVEVQDLCKSIISVQQEQIYCMKMKLKTL